LKLQTGYRSRQVKIHSIPFNYASTPYQLTKAHMASVLLFKTYPNDQAKVVTDEYPETQVCLPVDCYSWLFMLLLLLPNEVPCSHARS